MLCFVYWDLWKVSSVIVKCQWSYISCIKLVISPYDALLALFLTLYHRKYADRRSHIWIILSITSGLWWRTNVSHGVKARLLCFRIVSRWFWSFKKSFCVSGFLCIFFLHKNFYVSGFCVSGDSTEKKICLTTTAFSGMSKK